MRTFPRTRSAPNAMDAASFAVPGATAQVRGPQKANRQGFIGAKLPSRQTTVRGATELEKPNAMPVQGEAS